MLVALALDALPTADAKVLDAALGTPLTPDEVAHLCRLIDSSGARLQVEDVISQLTDRSLSALAAADVTDRARGVLEGLAAEATHDGPSRRPALTGITATSARSLPFERDGVPVNTGNASVQPPTSASACARRLTSEPRFSRRASMGRPGSVSSGVNSQVSISRSSQPPSASRVSRPGTPLTIAPSITSSAGTC